jgi:hypothetical protein
MERQVAAQQEQARVARQRLEADTARAAEERSRFEQERAKLEADAKKRAEELEGARRESAMRESSRMTAARRGGRRMLLSQARLSPELGLTSSTEQDEQMMRTM